MKIHTFPQGSEQWEQIRKGKATASRFKDILAPKTLKLSKSAENYAAELVAERLEIESPQFAPTYWMQYGMEAEDYAIAEFEHTNNLTVQRVGFVELNEHCGCSPDGLVGDTELIEVKCPKPETLIRYQINGQLPDEYRLQVQGSLWITGRTHCHFYAWHPQIHPMHIVVGRDEEVIAALESAIPAFLESVKVMQQCIQSRPASPEFQFVDTSEELV